jgi:hypothetical protein
MTKFFQFKKATTSKKDFFEKKVFGAKFKVYVMKFLQ